MTGTLGIPGGHFIPECGGLADAESIDGYEEMKGGRNMPYIDNSEEVMRPTAVPEPNEGGLRAVICDARIRLGRSIESASLILGFLMGGNTGTVEAKPADSLMDEAIGLGRDAETMVVLLDKISSVLGMR